MQQMARNVTMEGCGALRDCRYLLHDRDTKSTPNPSAQSLRQVNNELAAKNLSGVP
jgi:hypothetical protein